MDSIIPYDLITNLFALGVLGVNVLSIVLLIVLLFSFFSPKNSLVKKIGKLFHTYSLYFAFVFSLGATVGSLFMSELAGFVPCELCWYQRVFMYPQTFILLLAMYYKDARVFLYSLFLSAIGFLIAMWHVFIEYQPRFETCTEGSISCSTVQFEAFGFVTIPFMSASIFAFLILISALSLRSNRS